MNTTSTIDLKMTFAQAAFADVRDALPDFDFYGFAMSFGSVMYHGKKDKGSKTPSSLWNHIQATERNVTKQSHADQLSETEIMYERALAVLHEVRELKRTNERGEKVLVLGDNWREILQREAVQDIPSFFFDDIDALSIRPGELYLDYIQRLAKRPRALLFKLGGDLPENRFGVRPQLDFKETSQQFIDKKTFLYEIATLFLQARKDGIIRRKDMSVAEFVMTSPHVPSRLKDRTVLARHTKAHIPAAIRLLPGEHTLYRLGCGAIDLVKRVGRSGLAKAFTI